MSKLDKEIPDLVNSRFTGLVDAVQSGWFNQETGAANTSDFVTPSTVHAYSALEIGFIDFMGTKASAGSG